MFKKKLFSTIAIIYFIFSYFNLYTVNVPRSPGKVLQCLATETWNDLWKMRGHVLWTEQVQWACRQHLVKRKRLAKCKRLVKCKRLSKCKRPAKCKRLAKWPGNQCSCKNYCHRNPTKTYQWCHSIQQSCIIRHHLYKRTLCAFFCVLTLSSDDCKSCWKKGLLGAKIYTFLFVFYYLKTNNLVS